MDSCDGESDEEWNYVKPENGVNEDNGLEASVEEEQVVAVEKEEIFEQKTVDEEIVEEQVPAAVIQESHALAQAIAEPQEACAEVRIY